MGRLGCILTVVLVIVLVVGGGVGAAIYGYNQLQVSTQVTAVSAELGLSPDALGGVIAGAIRGEGMGALASAIKSVSIDGRVTLKNASPVPLWIPSTSNQVSIEGKQAGGPVPTPAFWLAAGESHSEPVRLSVPGSALPDIALRALANRGTINFEVETRLFMGPLALTRVTRSQYDARNALASGSPAR